METEEKGLIIPEKIDVMKVFTERDYTTKLLEEVKKKVLEVVSDVTTDKGRKAIRSNAAKVPEVKSFFEDARLSLVSEKKKQLSLIDAEGKFIRDSLDFLKAVAREPLTNWEAEQARIKEEARLAEVARIEAEQARIKYEEDWDSAISENEMIDRQREIERREKELEAQREEQRRKDEESRRERERIAREEQIRKDESARLEREKQEALTAAAKSRQQMLKEFGLEMELDVLRAMPEQVWNEFYSAKSKEFQAKQIEAQKLESERKAKEEAERIEKEAAQKAENERAEAMRKEGERLDKMATARQEMLKEIGVNLDFHSCRSMDEEVWNSFYSNKNKEYQDEQQKIWIEKMKAEREVERIKNERKEKEREAERLAEEKRSSSVGHQNKVKKEASASMLSVLEEVFQTDFPLDEVSKTIVDAIAAGKITNLSIKF